MLAKNRPLILITASLAILAIGLLVFNWINYKKSQIKKAESFLREYKVAKALEVLEDTKKKIKKNDSQVNTLVFYALVKSSKFELASQQLESIKQVPRGDFDDRFQEIVDILNNNEETDLLAQLIQKAKRLRLTENFFISLSQNRSDLESEMVVLETGLDYLRGAQDHQAAKKNKKKRREISSSKIESYILRRCIENANIYIGSKNYRKSLEYLKKAEDLDVIGNNTLKDDFYLNLALTYKSLGNFTQAWENMQLSAKLGNERAKTLISNLNKKYVP